MLVGESIEGLREINGRDDGSRPTILQILSDILEHVQEHVGHAAAADPPVLVGPDLHLFLGPIEDIRLVDL